MPQKICIISFDHWNYDYHIVNCLNNLGHIAHHIKIGDYQHQSLKDKITNALSKTFAKKNLKKIRRQEYIIQRLKELGQQDQILVINPEIIELKYHLKIKEFTKNYMAYLYDSMSRYSVDHLLKGVFDKIYSFDLEDIAKYGFLPTSNYNYIDNTIETKEVYDIGFVGSYDDRFDELISLLKQLKPYNIKHRCIVVGKERKLSKLIESYGDLIDFQFQPLSQNEMLAFYEQCHCIIDLIRKNQTGLSFRFFEAMGLRKKIITNNKSVKAYNFYKPENIFVLEDSKVPSKAFISTDYENLPEEIYHEYTLKSWVTNIFSL